MEAPSDIHRLVRSLGSEVRRPGLFPGGFVGNVPVEPITDPILRELAEKPDWREYDDMWRLPEVYDPWRHMTAQVLSEPFEIQAVYAPARN